MTKALRDARTAPEEVDHDNADGINTPKNDKMEFVDLRAEFGGRVAHVSIAHNKSQIGLTLSTAGAIEAVLSNSFEFGGQNAALVLSAFACRLRA